MKPKARRAGTVIVSTGFHKTHVTTAAREASDRGLLRIAITSIYPTPRLKRAIQRLRVGGRGRLARLLERDEGLPDANTRAIFLPEAIWEAARLIARVPLVRGLHPLLSAASMYLYGRCARRPVRAAAEGAGIYHFRAGFGQSSVGDARSRGLHVLCDHAIAHPSLLEDLVAHGGSFPAAAPARPPSDPVERAILADIDRSDSILVNSDFVKDTFLAMGWPAEAIHVVYLGVDNAFLAQMPQPQPPRVAAMPGTIRMLFAGRLEPRKGADVLVEALRSLDDVTWELVVAGPVVPEVWSRHGDFLSDPRVTLAGTLRRPDLMRLMMAIPVFVFPSLAEGSARVVFESLACGAYVITTPNAGSIVEDGVHGSIVPAGSAGELSAAIARAAHEPALVCRMGAANADLIRSRYRQEHYGRALHNLYNRLAIPTPET